MSASQLGFPHCIDSNTGTSGTVVIHPGPACVFAAGERDCPPHPAFKVTGSLDIGVVGSVDADSLWRFPKCLVGRLGIKPVDAAVAVLIGLINSADKSGGRSSMPRDFIATLSLVASGRSRMFVSMRDIASRA